MHVALLFWGLVILCCGFAAAFGDQAGQRIAICCVFASIATLLVTATRPAWIHPHVPAFCVDLAMLAALVWVALRSDRWFPIWVAGFQLLAVTTHLASIVAPLFAPRIYFLAQALWSVPMLFSLVIGVVCDRRAGICDEADGDASVG